MKDKYIVTDTDGFTLSCPTVVFLAKDVFAMAAIQRYVDSLYDLPIVRSGRESCRSSRTGEGTTGAR